MFSLKDYIFAGIVAALIALAAWLWVDKAAVEVLLADQKTETQRERGRTLEAQGQLKDHHAKQAAIHAANARSVLTLTERLMTQASQSEKEKADALETAAATHAAALASLRDRPQRPTTKPRGDVQHVPGAAGPAPERGCTPDQLYREDAALALGFGLEADQLRAEVLDLHRRLAEAGSTAQAANLLGPLK